MVLLGVTIGMEKCPKSGLQSIVSLTNVGGQQTTKHDISLGYSLSSEISWKQGERSRDKKKPSQQLKSTKGLKQPGESS